jgi:hypothetical protein
VVVHFGGADLKPKRGDQTLHQISTPITDSGNKMMYHDLDKVYEAPSSAIKFPTELSSHFSAVALNCRATTIMFWDAEKVRITDYQNPRNPIPQLSTHAGMRPYNCKHVYLVPAEGEKDDWDFVLAKDGTTEFTLPVNSVTTHLKVISIPSGHVLKPYLYCLLSSLIQPSDPESNVETKEIKALQQRKYPEQYALFFGLK